jgi:hypothetical protein
MIITSITSAKTKRELDRIFMLAQAHKIPLETAYRQAKELRAKDLQRRLAM